MYQRSLAVVNAEIAVGNNRRDSTRDGWIGMQRFSQILLTDHVLNVSEITMVMARRPHYTCNCPYLERSWLAPRLLGRLYEFLDCKAFGDESRRLGCLGGCSGS